MCVGGMDIRPQIKKLSRAHQFVIATPGRALDLIKKRFILPEIIQNSCPRRSRQDAKLGFKQTWKDMLKSSRQKLYQTVAICQEETMNSIHRKISSKII